jgi:lipopolysaccharide transport system ATP-binding protein
MLKAIQVEGVSKQYRLGQIGTGSLKHDMNRWWHQVRGKEDPYLKIGEANDRSKKGSSEYVWSLRDVSFDIEQGDSVGIIGRNGAGKSTLLKILSRVTAPTTGSLKVKGRIASLLEVGTGFHPDLSGRDNIYLNGAILGMRKHEIKRKFDEIVDFAGVERYIDTPVKRYSSGMYVRLAFAVAAHLESEILIVDEVLAVGDAEFQKKCLGKMGQVSKGEGRTVLFVSHNITAVKTLCDFGMVLENGTTKFMGKAHEAASYYLKGNSESQNTKNFGKLYDTEYFTLHEISLNPKGQDSDAILDEYQEIEINTVLTVKKDSQRLHFTYLLSNENGEALFTFTHASNNLKLIDGYNHLKCFLPKGFLNIGNYYLSVYLIEDAARSLFAENNILSFHIHEGSRGVGDWMGREPGVIKPIFNWTIKNSYEESY